ncbi:MAG: DUF951 domain-containing protein [Thermoflexales bacterium]|nr:DUF951 domain-containing protein [Thermoflexales bacterium]
MPVTINVGDVVRMRKPHPCGSFDWQVTRIGADIGLKCQTCGRRVMLTRHDFEKRLKTILEHATPPDEPPGSLRGNPSGLL